MYEEIIHAFSLKYGLDKDLVEALIAHESGGNMWMVKAYPWVKNKFHFAREYADKLQISFETETMGQMCRWGLMQVQGSIARENGYEGLISQLLDPRLNIEFGCKELKRLFVRYGNEMDVVAAYGAGGAYARTLGGRYANETYVDAVYLRLREMRKLV